MSAPVISSFNLSAWALRHKALTLFAMLTLATGGAMSYFGLGRAEDPSFTLKQMIVQVDWPGASSDEMSRQVVDPIERKLEELASLDHLDSQTQPGHAIVTISLRDDTLPAQVQPLWYQVRKKIADLAPMLPPGTCSPWFTPSPATDSACRN